MKQFFYLIKSLRYFNQGFHRIESTPATQILNNKCQLIKINTNSLTLLFHRNRLLNRLLNQLLDHLLDPILNHGNE